MGDPLQLPPTLPGETASAHGLDRTLFERLHEAGQPTHLLGTQYRVRWACM
jgi:superfamily I DNA and/or RNA helicase